MSSVSALTHVQRVRILYKTCLRLHRGLPTQMQIIGDAYVKDEFKRLVLIQFHSIRKTKKRKKKMKVFFYYGWL